MAEASAPTSSGERQASWECDRKDRLTAAARTYAARARGPFRPSLPTNQDQDARRDGEHGHDDSDGRNWKADHLKQTGHDEPDCR